MGTSYIHCTCMCHFGACGLQSNHGVRRQLTISALGHAAKAENHAIVGITLTKSCSASIFVVQTENNDGDYKLAEIISILDGAHLMFTHELKSFIYYFCEVIKTLHPNIQLSTSLEQSSIEPDLEQQSSVEVQPSLYLWLFA